MNDEVKLNNAAEPGDSFMNATGRLEYTLTNDYLFHVVMQKNEKVLRGLIGSLLGLEQDDIKSVLLKNPIVFGEAIGDKDVILDLKVVLNDDQMLNIEMQVKKREDWPERSLTYLCKNFDNLKSGQDYSEVMPCLHIGIIDFVLFEGKSEFYSRYRLMNTNDHHIYTSKFGINVLNLRYIENATNDDRNAELDAWARLFKAGTWEELKQMAQEYDFAKEAATSIYAVSADEAIKLQCEARERNERDMLSSYRAGIRHEQANTEHERKRADSEKKRADKNESDLNKTKDDLNKTKNDLDNANKRIKELEALLK